MHWLSTGPNTKKKSKRERKKRKKRNSFGIEATWQFTSAQAQGFSPHLLK
jgi:hypothetical protein